MSTTAETMIRQIEDRIALRRKMHEPEELVTVPVGMAEVDLEVAGCSFIDATGILLDWMGAPPDVRHTCLVIAGLSGGDYKNFSEITQEKMAARCGVSLPTMRARLKDLWDWQQQKNYSVIEIEKRDYNPEHGQYATTLYRPTIVRYSGLFIRKLREKGLRPVYRHQSVTDGTVKIIDEVTVEIVDEMPEASHLYDRNRKPKPKPAKQRQIGFVEEGDVILQRAAHIWCDRMEKGNYIIKDYGPQAINIIQDIFMTRGKAQVERAREHREAMKNINAAISQKAKSREERP